MTKLGDITDARMLQSIMKNSRGLLNKLNRVVESGIDTTADTIDRVIPDKVVDAIDSVMPEKEETTVKEEVKVEEVLDVNEEVNKQVGAAQSVEEEEVIMDKEVQNKEAEVDYKELQQDLKDYAEELEEELSEELDQDEFYLQINLIGNLVKDKPGMTAQEIFAACCASRDANAKGILTREHIDRLNAIMKAWCRLYDHGGPCYSADPRRDEFEKIYMDAAMYTYELSIAMGLQVDKPALPKRVEKKQVTNKVPVGTTTKKETSNMKTSSDAVKTKENNPVVVTDHDKVAEEQRQRAAQLREKHNVPTRPKAEVVGTAVGTVVGRGTEAIGRGTVVAAKTSGTFVRDEVAPAIATGAKTTWSVLKGIAKGAKDGYVESKARRS